MRALLGFILTLSLVLSSSPAQSLAPCTPVDHCAAAVSCSTLDDSQCGTCQAGYWLSEAGTADTCPACTSVVGCTSTLSCTGAANSQCTACDVGRYLQQSPSPASADSCPTCSQVDHCRSDVTETCTQASNSQCTACDVGYYASNAGPATVCEACTTISSCVTPGGCSSAGTSQCLTCADGTYLVNGVADTCATCLGVSHCNGDVTCTTLGNSVCNGVCDSGYYRTPTGQCSACSALPHCTSELTCTTPTDSVCTQCEDPGFYLDGGHCFDCTAITGCVSTPLACTSATTSRCATCGAGRYLDTSARPAGADTCPTCADVSHCATQESCSTGQNSRCSTCAAGFFRVAGDPTTPDTCQACTAVPGCTSSLTCTNASDSICTACAFGKYLDPSTHTCNACTDVANCAAQESCSTASNSVCTSCASGYWRSVGQPTVCTQCTAIAHCTSTLTCTTASSSQCTACEGGFVLAPSGTECREQCTRADDCSDHGTPAANGFRPSNCGCVCDVGWAGPACNAHVDPTPTFTPPAVETATPTATPTPSPTATPGVEALNHFLCYETQQRALNRIGVIVDDDFASRNLTVKRAKRLCAPASKNGEDPTAPDDLAHLSAYTIKQTSPRFAREHDVLITPDNVLFPPITVDIVRPERLLVPAAESDGETPPPALAAPIDFYQCYRVKGGRTRLSGVTVETDVVSGPVVVDVKRALHFCRPVHTGGTLVDPVRDLMCYQVRTRPLPQPGIRVSTTNELESSSFNIFGLRELCVPVTRPGVCGNGRVDAVGEQCDDGNRSSGDGCSATCQDEGGCFQGRC